VPPNSGLRRFYLVVSFDGRPELAQKVAPDERQLNLTERNRESSSWQCRVHNLRDSVVERQGNARGSSSQTPAKKKAVPQPLHTEIRFPSVVRKSKSLPLLHRPETTTFALQINRLAAQWNA